MMTTSLMTITPELAKSILDSSNNNNRNISTDRVDTYARAMSAGQWMLTHQGISFYDDGELADGQHRLMAVVKSGSTIQMLCTHGLSRMCLIGIDSGRPRDATGVIQIAGGGDDVTSRHVGIIRKAVKSGLVRGMPPTSHLSPAEIYSVFKANKEKIDFGAKSMKKNAAKLGSAAVRVAACCAYGKIDHAKLVCFFDVLSSGVMEKEEDRTVVTLREAILSGRINTGAATASRDEIVTMCQMMKAYDDGAVMTRLKRSVVEPFDMMI